MKNTKTHDQKNGLHTKKYQNGFERAAPKLSKHTLSDIENEYRIQEYEKLLRDIHPDFCKRLIERAPAITPMEMRVCILARTFVGIKESATILSTSESNIESHRSHARGKLHIESRKMSLISALHAV